ncbi:MAG: hypothetical protein ACRES2_01885 [Steroidobacteraceae bacterium]
MISIGELWLPILLSAVFIFAASSIIHMFLGYHWNDLRAPAQQDAILDAMRSLNVQPGDYAMPKPDSMKQFNSPEFRAKLEGGSMILMTVARGTMAMGKMLGQWFVYLLIVSLFCAYIAGRELPPGAQYLTVFRLVGFTAFMGYAMAMPQAAIWYHRNWRMTLVTMFDGLVYGLLTGGTFGWLWPH